MRVAHALAFHVEIVDADVLALISVPGRIEIALAFNDVGQNRVTCRDGQRKPTLRVHGHIEVLGLGDHIAHGPLRPVLPAGNDPDHGVLFLDDRHVDRRHGAVARLHHLVRGGQIGPQLETVHAAMPIPLRHLLMHDATPRRHPLDFARPNDASVAEAVLMLDVSVEHIRDRFDATVRVPGESSDIVPRVVRAEIVQEQERVKLRHLAVAKSAPQMDASTFDRGLALPDRLDASDRRAHHLSPIGAALASRRAMT